MHNTPSFRLHALLPLSAGLIVSQLLATLFVRQSNIDLLKNLDALQAAGWLAIPAGPAAEKLYLWGSAFWGGLFFTLSLGIGLSLATWGLLCLWQRFFANNIKLLLIPLALWATLLVWVNSAGIVLYPTLFVLCTPMATALTAWRQGAPLAAQDTDKLWYIPLLTLLVLGGLWTAHFKLNQQLFISIRDHLLLSNPIGRKVNDFYYRNTLYAAQSFKSFSQKTLRTATITNSPSEGTTRRLINTLASYDILVTPVYTEPDLKINFINSMLTLTVPPAYTIHVEQLRFWSDLKKSLGQLASVSDRYASFRYITYYGLLFGFPILLYTLLDGAVRRLGGLFIKGRALVWTRAATCFTLGILLFVPMLAGSPVKITQKDLSAALATKDWPTRVAALRFIEQNKINIAAYPHYQSLLTSPRVVERYYLARALAFSSHPNAVNQLLQLTRDPQPNVVCQAYYALGVRRERRAIGPIQRQLLQSDHWYTQWYGYRALRRMGWRQIQSKSTD